MESAVSCPLVSNHLFLLEKDEEKEGCEFVGCAVMPSVLHTTIATETILVFCVLFTANGRKNQSFIQHAECTGQRVYSKIPW